MVYLHWRVKIHMNWQFTYVSGISQYVVIGHSVRIQDLSTVQRKHFKLSLIPLDFLEGENLSDFFSTLFNIASSADPQTPLWRRMLELNPGLLRVDLIHNRLDIIHKFG